MEIKRAFETDNDFKQIANEIINQNGQILEMNAHILKIASTFACFVKADLNEFETEKKDS